MRSAATRHASLAASLSALLCLACVCRSAAQSESLEQLWRSGQFSTLRAQFTAQYEAGDRSPAFLSEAARGAEEMRSFADAALLFGAYADAVGPAEAEAFREAKYKQWQSLDSAGKPQESWLPAARREVAALSSAPGSSQQQLALELAALLESVVSGSLSAGETLRTRFPASPVVLRAAKSEADALSSLSDDRKRLAGAKSFVAKYPGCHWQHLAYRLWMFSAARLGQNKELQAAAAQYLAAYPEHPASNGAISRHYLDSGILAEAGLKHAERSMKLYEQLLGCDGTLQGIASADRATRSALPAQDWEPPGQRELFMEYLGSRYNLARYQLSVNQRKAALALLEPVISASPFSGLDEQTPAPYCVLAGEAAEGLGNEEQAYRYYLRTLAWPDLAGRQVLQAEPRLAALRGKLSEQQQAAARAALIPAGLEAADIPAFSDVTKAAGLSGVEALRVALGDADGDGDDDLLFDGTKLYLNNGRSGFTKAGDEWGLPRPAAFAGGLERGSQSRDGIKGGIFADYDNDGDLDLYCFGTGKGNDRLLRNEGSRFVDISAISGDATDSDPTEAAAWLDYDRDGWLDIYSAGYSDRTRLAEPGGSGHPDRLLRNDRGRKFDLTSAAVPSGLTRGASASVCVTDIDANGWPDVYVGNRSGGESLLLLNRDGGFVSAARPLNLTCSLPSAPLASASDGSSVWPLTSFGDCWGAALGDLNGDGMPDLLQCQHGRRISNAILDPALQLHLSQGGEGALAPFRADGGAGLRYDDSLACPVLLDANGDGRLDIYFTSSADSGSGHLYLQTARGFEDVTYLSGASSGSAFGAACGDIDGDGDPDLIICSNRGVRLLRNDSSARLWLKADCRTRAGAPAVGVRISLREGNELQLRETASGSGLGCGNGLGACFGVRGGILSIEALFPSGAKVSRALKLNSSTVITLQEDGDGDSEALPGTPRQPAPPVRDSEETTTGLEDLQRGGGGRSGN